MNELRLRPDALAWRKIDNELVAVDVAASQYLSANQTGAMLWQMLADGATPAQLAERLVERFGISSEQARTDVDAFVQDLKRRGLLAG
jgi:Coenzyme PQQ synthesis protein D (PqqD)